MILSKLYANRILIILLFMGLTTLTSPCFSTPNGYSWRVGEVTYRYSPSSRKLTAECNGMTLEPLHGFGPTFLFKDGEKSAGSLDTSLVSSQPFAKGASCRYQVRDKGETAEYTIDILPDKGGLKLHIHDASLSCTRMGAGETIGQGKWIRFSYTRNAEAYAQPFWPLIAWYPNKNVYVAVIWDMAKSSGSTWDAPDQRFSGEGPFTAALDVVYNPRTDGTRMPLNETLSLRIGTDLWRTVPIPAQLPSQYTKELSRSIFLDVWGGNARDTEYFLRYLSAITMKRIRFLTIFENWQAGGFDSMDPDSILMPKYPPNPGIGSVKDFQSLSKYARSVGEFGLRTNYVYLRPLSPSALAGQAVPALKPDGTKAWFTRPSDWLPLAKRQETEIQNLFHTNASFTDQMTSSGGPWGYIDYNAHQKNAGAMSQALKYQRELALLIKSIHHGPLGSESNMDEQLLGEYVDTGDFGMFDGYHRAITPEFKLHRLQQLSVFYGMGLMYRFYEMPPFKRFSSGTANYMSDPKQYDDYRAAEVLYGNGGYLFYYPNTPWDYVITECLLIGTLQTHYLLQPVKDVRYWSDGHWVTLQDILKAGVNPLTADWNPQPDCLKRIWVQYQNGLNIIVNRLPDDFSVKAGGDTVILPQSGWIAWDGTGKLLAYSACAPGTLHRVDFIRDDNAGMQYLNPRGEKVMGQTQPTLWENGKVVMRLNPSNGDAWVEGKRMKYAPPSPPALTRLDFQFNHDARGWMGQSNLSPLRIVDGALTARIIGTDPYVIAPAINLAPDSVKEITICMKVSCGTYAQIYFQAEGAKATLEQMCVRFPIKPGTDFQVYHIPIGENPYWKGHRITSLRLDPERGFSPGDFALKWIKGD